MITFIIPLIHPNHSKVKSYSDIFNYLSRTIINLLNQTIDVNIIIVCHKKPKWFLNTDKRIKFIFVNSIIFNILKNLDEKSKNIIYYKDNKYYEYLNYPGKYHNKDKGLKYFIALLYLSLEKNKPDFVGIIDGDDFIDINLGKYLMNQPLKYNQFFINKGYLMLAKNDSINIEISSIYKIKKFTDICGSNLLNNFYKNRIVNELLINEIIINIKENPNAWKVLPLFLGKHQMYIGNKVSHNFHYLFKIKYIPFFACVKFLHTNNHSLCKEYNEKKMIKKYTQKGISPKYNNKILNDFRIIQNLQ